MSEYIQREIQKNVRYPKLLLNLSLRRLTKIPIEVFNILNLKHLNLSINQLQEIPIDIRKMINLTHLYLSNNNLTEISSRIENLTKLKSLYLNNNKLISLPDEIGNLTKLKSLYLNNNELISIPNSLGNLGNLKYLDISDNHIISIPNSIRNCRELNIFYNILEYVPEPIQRMLNEQKIYSDRQNVHNHNIQEGVKNGIEYILSIKPLLTFDILREEILDNDIFTDESKFLLFEYIENKEVHSVLNITFEELLLNTYSF